MTDAETMRADHAVRADWQALVEAQKRSFDADDRLRDCPTLGLAHEYARRWFERRDAKDALDRARAMYENSMRRYDALLLLHRVTLPIDLKAG